MYSPALSFWFFITLSDASEIFSNTGSKLDIELFIAVMTSLCRLLGARSERKEEEILLPAIGKASQGTGQHRERETM
jgi:hypothetical protein